jgi:glycosyltransferase involved in cell wall biosynthesis
MRILIVSPWCDDIDLESCKGTPENAYLIKELLRRNHTVCLVCQGSVEEIPESMRVRLKIYPVRKFPWIQPRQLNYFTAPFMHRLYGNYLRKLVGKIAEKENIEVIYNIAGFGHRELLRLARRMSIRYAVKTMGTIFFGEGNFNPLRRFQYFKEHLIFKYRADRYFCVDDGTGTYEVAKRYGVSESNIIALPNPKPPIVELIKEPRAPRFSCGYFSRFDKLKGTDLFCRIADRVLAENSNIIFRIAGDGPLRSCVEKLKKKYPQNVVYLGFLTHIATLEEYSRINLLLSTNRYSNLTLPVVEALSYGIPVIVFNTQETSKLIKDEINGFLVKPFEVEHFASKILHIAEKEDILEKLSKGARETSASLPSWEDRIEKEIDKLEELTK